MPEGDTIFRTATVLRSALAGAEVLRFEAPRPALRATGARHPRRSVEARGKHLLIAFDDERVLHTHMQMSGSWHVYRSGRTVARPAQRMRVLLEVPGTVAVCFDAPVVELLASATSRASAALRAGAGSVLAGSGSRRRAGASGAAPPEVEIGVALLDQRVASGIGNVIKSETLFARRVDPFTLLGVWTRTTRRGLYATASELLRRNLSGGPRVTSREGSPSTGGPDARARDAGRDREPARARRRG